MGSRGKEKRRTARRRVLNVSWHMLRETGMKWRGEERMVHRRGMGEGVVLFVENNCGRSGRVSAEVKTSR